MHLQKQVTVDCYFSSGSSIRIIDDKVCREKCPDPGCIYVCPAGMFEVKDGQVIFDSSGVCLECGACRLVCRNIDFCYPPAGLGIVHQFG